MPYTDYLKKQKTEEDELNIAPRLLHVGSECTEPSWYNLEHAHNSCEIIYVTEGSESTIIRGQRYEVSAGDTIVINSGSVHQEWGDLEHVRKCIVVTFDQFQLNGLPENHLLDKAANPIIHPTQDKEILASSFQMLLRESTRDSLYGFTLSHLLLQKIIIILLRNSGKSKKNPKNYNNECEIVKQYIDAHFREKIQLEDIAQQIFVSKGHLSHMFRSQTGEAPIRYLIRKRMEEAKRLLTETGDSIQQVAESVGYDSAVYFCQIFTKEVGISPSQYRRKNRRGL